MNKFNAFFVGSVVATVALLVLAGSPNPVSISGSQAFTNDVTLNKIYPVVTTRPIYTDKGYLAPVTFYDSGGNHSVAWSWDNNVGGFTIQGALGSTGGIYTSGGLLWFLTSDTRLVDLSGGGFAIIDTNHFYRVTFKDGVIYASAASMTNGNATTFFNAGTVPAARLPADLALTDASNYFDSTHSNHMAGQIMADKGLIVLNDTSQLQPLSNGTNMPVDFAVPVSIFTPTNNVFFIFSTNFSTAGSEDKLFKLKGSASNFTVKFGTDFTNLYGVYTTNGYILGNSNGPHMLAIHIDAAHGTETAAIIPPNN